MSIVPRPVDSRPSLRIPRDGGMSLFELLLLLALVVTLGAILVPYFSSSFEESRVERAVADIRGIQTEIRRHARTHRRLPESLFEISARIPVDPWGNLYQFRLLDGDEVSNRARLDRFRVPLNSDYDLYSLGPDGESDRTLAARTSRDDVVRANNGEYLGPASGF